jgi:hypothetical protein
MSLRTEAILCVAAIAVVAAVTFNMSFPTAVAIELTGGTVVTCAVLLGTRHRRSGDRQGREPSDRNHAERIAVSRAWRASLVRTCV